MELVTGFAGQAHVNPIDMAHVNAVAFGHDAYLLDTQNKLKPTLATANKLVVGTGDLMIQGHHFTVVQSEEIALQSGISGQKRNALVCARYNKASGTGIETASWVVKYGPATTGTPTDPAVTTGNILDGVASVHEEPIFRIECNGITPGNPILLVPEFQSNAKFRTSIAPIKVTVTGKNATNTYFNCVAYPALRLCHIVGSFTPSKLLKAGSSNAFADFPAAYKPIFETAFAVAKSGTTDASVWITAGGELIACAKIDSINTNISFAGVWRY